MLQHRAVIVGLAVLAAAACSPALNWREVALDGSSARALLPCKAERTARVVPLGGVPTDLAVTGCDADGMTFAVMTARLPADRPVDDVLAGWQQATLANMRADDASTKRTAFRPTGGLPLPHAQRLVAQGQRADGQAVFGHGVWSARAAPGGGTELLHAMLYARRPAQDAADAFFGGLGWP